jgi:hypothetical protein
MDIALKSHGRISSARAKASVGIIAMTLTVFACTCVIFALSNNAQASPTTVEQSAWITSRLAYVTFREPTDTAIAHLADGLKI